MARTTGRRRWASRVAILAAAVAATGAGWTQLLPAADSVLASPVEEKKPTDKPDGLPDAPPKTDPSPKPDGSALPGGSAKPDAATRPAADVAGELMRTITPATAPATRPIGAADDAATKPADPHAGHAAGTAKAADGKLADAKKPDGKKAVPVSAEARALLDKVRDAYKGLSGLKLAGTITGEFDLNGERQTNRAEFAAAFRSAGEFRHQLRELPPAGGAQPVIADEKKDVAPKGDAKAEPAKADAGKPATAATDSMTVGGTGKKLYVYYPRYNYYYLADVPKERTGDALGKTVNGLLSQQNLSLLLAVVADASAELLDGPDKVEKVPDVTIGGDACPALRLGLGKEMAVTVAFDPKTSFVRRAAFDYRGLAEAKKQQDVKAAMVTVDYTLTEPAADRDAAADLKPEAFAWAPPVGARDVTATADAGGGDDADDGSPAAAHQELIGKPAPDFKLAGPDGVEVKLSDLKGSVVLLDFWATWCGPCRASLPHLDEIYQERKDKGLKGYAVDLRENPGTVKAFVEKTKLGLPVLFDKDGKVAKTFGVSGIPQTVVIDKEGKVVKIVVGSGTHEQVKAAIDEAMK
jgi:peroxiredoxin